MKILILFSILFSLTLNGQQKLDTIYANEYKNVAMFFPKPIRQGITGASNFVFTYNREKEQYFGLLKAQPGTESNLLAVTNDGQVYSYILKYAKVLPKLNYFIDNKESIGNESSRVILEKSDTKPITQFSNRITFIEKFCNYLLKLDPETLKTKRKNGLKLQLQQIMYQGNEVYLVLDFENNSEINFEVDYLNVYRVNGNKKRKSSFQKLQQEIIYKHIFPSNVKSKKSARFVFVLPKFVLGVNEKLMIEMKELSGNRRVDLRTRF